MAAARDYDVMAKHIVDASDKLNYAGANKLYVHLKAKNQYVPYDIVKAFTDRQPERQIFAQPRRVRHPRREGPAMQRPPNLNEGRVTALDINDRWMADLADLTAQPSGGGGDPPYQYILVVLNVFSKQLWARPLRTKTAAVVTDAFNEILHGQRAPSRLDTDAGLEFTGPFVRLLEEKNILHIVKDTEDPNTLAPIDRVIGILKRSIFRRVVADEDKDWAANLQKTVDGYNETMHSSLQGRSPEEVQDDPELQFALRRANSEAMMHNANVIKARDNKLLSKGAFRVQDPKRPFIRSYHPRYGDAVHEIANIRDGFVTDAQGNTYKSRHTLAVPSGSAPATHTEQMRGGNAIVERKQTSTLDPFKERIATFLGDLGKFEHEVATYMKELGMEALMTHGLNYRKALRLLGFTVHGNGRGSGRQLVTRGDTPAAPAAPVPAAPAPRRMSAAMAASVGLLGRPSPAAAAAAIAAPVRRRIAGKQPGTVRP